MSTAVFATVSVSLNVDVASHAFASYKAAASSKLRYSYSLWLLLDLIAGRFFNETRTPFRQD
jgi:hypothetical protein